MNTAWLIHNAMATEEADAYLYSEPLWPDYNQLVYIDNPFSLVVGAIRPGIASTIITTRSSTSRASCSPVPAICRYHRARGFARHGLLQPARPAARVCSSQHIRDGGMGAGASASGSQRRHLFRGGGRRAAFQVPPVARAGDSVRRLSLHVQRRIGALRIARSFEPEWSRHAATAIGSDRRGRQFRSRLSRRFAELPDGYADE